MNVGIIGAGWIAGKMAATIAGIPKERGIVNYAIASRDLHKAQEFAAAKGFLKAYGSYKELVDDPDVDLVYIATPHSHHFEPAKLAIEAGKPVLCEKAFMANAAQTEEILSLAHAKGVFITEAIWTRYMPLSLKIKELIDSGVIGEPRLLRASLCYQMDKKVRILRPDLCGGALLDIGVYCLNFARMYFGTDIVSTSSSCEKFPGDVDKCDAISLTFADGKVAHLSSDASCLCNREGIICGSEGYLVVENINCPEKVTLYKGYKPVESWYPPKEQVTGYEYQVFASEDAIAKGLVESPFMPHAETLSIMKQMDALRKEWGIVYPMD